MNTTYNPILEIQELRRFRVFTPLAAPRLGTALVLEPDTGEPLVIQAGQRIPDPHMGNYKRSFLIDLGQYSLRLEEELPSADPAFLFRGSVTFNCRVEKPEIIAQHGIRDMTASVRSPLVRMMRRIARMYDISNFNTAEAALNEELDKFSGDPAYHLSNYLVELSVGNEAAAQSSTNYYDTNRDIRIETIRRDAMSGVVAGGRDKLFAQWLAKYDGDPSALLEMEAEAKALESDNLLRAMSILAPRGGDTEAFDTREERRRLLRRFLSDSGAGTSPKREPTTLRRSRIAGSLGPSTSRRETREAPDPADGDSEAEPPDRSSRLRRGTDSAAGHPEDGSAHPPVPKDGPAEEGTARGSSAEELHSPRASRVRGLRPNRPAPPRRATPRDPDAPSG
jgi:hypothetical protein